MRVRSVMGLLAMVAVLTVGCEHFGGCRKPTRLYRDHRELPDVLKNEGPPPVIVPKNSGTPGGASGGS